MLFDGKNFVVKSDEGTVDVVCGKVVLYVRGGGGGGGGGGSATWGEITGTLSDQTDLVTALNAKANTSALKAMAYVADAPSDGSEYVRKNGAWAVTSAASEWGDITGTLSDQTDLQNALNAKQNALTFDNAPTDGSSNPVTSDGIFEALKSKLNESAVADEYNTYTAYVSGDIVTHEGGLYRFTASSADPWSFADVDEITFVEWEADNYYAAGTYISHVGDYYRAKKNFMWGEWDPYQVDSTFDTLSVAEFDPTEQYLSGDTTSYNGTYYVFLTDYQGVSWDPTIVTEITVEELLAQKVGEAPINNNEYVRKNGGWVVSSGGGGGGSAAWGDITGTLSNQTDLQTALDAKQNVLTFDTTPRLSSTNPVTSDGIKTQLNQLSSDISGKASINSLGALAYRNTVNYVSQVTNKPELGTMSEIDDAPSDSKSYARKNGAWSEVTGGISSVAWGDITGTLASQTDLKTALDAKANTADLGDLASQDTVDYATEVTNKPTLGTMSAVDDAPSNGSEYVRKNGAWAVASGGGSVAWGGISGTLSDQTDLQTALNAKANSADMGGIQVRPNYIISDTDLTDGVSSLASGTLYLYYEV